MTILVVIAAPRVARAEQPVVPPPPAVERARAQAAMEAYFDGEIRGGYVLAGMGLAGLVAGGLLYRQGGSVARGASYPLLGLGLLHLAAGIYIGIASSRRIDKFTKEIEQDPEAFVARERTRMTGVSRTFTGLKIAEVVLIAGGLAGAGFGWRTDRPRLQGAGLALALEAGMTLGFDIVAARRAHRYQDALAQTSMAASVDPETGETRASILYAGSF